MAELTIRGVSAELVRRFAAFCDRNVTSSEDVLVAYMQGVVDGTQSIEGLELVRGPRPAPGGTAGWSRSADDDHELIGEGLVRVGAITKAQLRMILQMQKQGDRRRFGEIAIELGYVDDEAIKRYLESGGTPR